MHIPHTAHNVKDHIYTSHLWIQVESFQGVYDQWIFSKAVIHDQVQAIQEAGGLNNGLEVGIVQTLDKDNVQKKYTQALSVRCHKQSKVSINR